MITHMPPATTPDCACPVCGRQSKAFFAALDCIYFRCPTCEARFLDPVHYPKPDTEHAHYLHHENDVDDLGYRRFLSKLTVPLLGVLPKGARGLDYGCGPGPALAAMLQERGHPMALYDPFFAPDPAPLDDIYDFVTCTEVVEHFHNPPASFAQVRALVRQGGWLAIMTCFQTDDSRFANWHYRMDPTHVVFYGEHTFRFLAQSWGWRCEVPEKDVVLMQRPMGISE